MRFMAAIGGAAVAASAAAQVPAPTVQQAFEAASALDVTGTPAQRLAAWSALEQRVAHSPRNRSIVAIRKSRALLALNRRDEALAAARRGLADLPASDASLRLDRFDATLLIGQVAEAALDYAAADQSYREAETLASVPVDTLSALRGRLKVEMFVDPPAAADVSTKIDALMTSESIAKGSAGSLRRLQAELLLNRGDFAGARDKAAIAVKLNGGLTSRSDLDDVRARSTYAIAALLGDKPDLARQYLAMTGAGRQPKGAFGTGVSLAPPECGGEAGLRPNDLAVVEFSIDDDGSVGYSEPVYAAGGGASALEFARAARDWFWTPEQVRDIPEFYRYRVRVEMRCATGFERPSIYSLLDAALGDWLEEKGVTPPPLPTGSDPQVLSGERAALLAIAAAKGDAALDLVPALQLVARNAAVPRAEANAAARRALGILETNRIMGLPRLAVETAVWRTAGAEYDYDAVTRRAADALATPIYATDAQARTALRIIAASGYRTKPKEALPFLAAVAGDAQADKDDPLRAAALVQLASTEYALGDVAAARAAFAQSGLDAKSCALVDKPPTLVKVGGTFPMEAMQWGFEGWTRVQFDVAADGSTANERVVLAYPPFVFSTAGRKTMDTAKFSKTYRPDGALGCGGTVSNVRFLLPH